MMLRLRKSYLFCATGLLFLSVFTIKLSAQEDFFDINSIREIRITFEQTNWDHILDSLFEAGDEDRLLGNLTINGQTLDSVGIRYKGYSSVNVDHLKNPLNIKLDYIIEDQEYLGINKIKLSNVIHDPTFIREVLCFEIARKYLPASRANWANLYINDALIGLYVNVESVNKDFTDNHFGSRRNSFFKGEPLELEYPFGSNANLEYYDNDTTTYVPYYSLESDFGWNELLNLIYILNNQPENIEDILNIDRTLWMHALNYVMVNLDSYIAYAQNYYLYMDNNGRFNPIPWDLNMSFGSFRFSDGSYGALTGNVTIDQAKNLDPLQLMEYAVSPRPLLVRLMQNPTYIKMYLAHIRTIVNENLASGEYLVRGETLQDLINESVENDPNKFYSYDDFINNLTQTVGGSGNMIEYPGISDLMEGRVEYLSNYEGFQGAPEISGVINEPEQPAPGEEIAIIATIMDVTNACIYYRTNENGRFIKQEMFDDGNHNDAQAGDGIFGTFINVGEFMVQYYLWAENEIAGYFLPERAAYEYFTIQCNTQEVDVVINEFMASNSNAVADQDGEYDDWIELFNRSEIDMRMDGLYLSDNPSNITKWALPDTTIRANDYLIVWADEDEFQQGLHANFKLSASGEQLYLAQSTVQVIDSVIFGAQTTDVSTGRFPNGAGPFVKMPFTFASPNITYSLEEIEHDLFIFIYPNPSRGISDIRYQIPIGNWQLAIGKKVEVSVFDIRGQQVRMLVNKEQDPGEYVVCFDGSDLPAGIYFIRIISSGNVSNKKLILL